MEEGLAPSTPVYFGRLEDSLSDNTMRHEPIDILWRHLRRRTLPKVDSNMW